MSDLLDGIVNGVVSCFCPGACLPNSNSHSDAETGVVKQEGTGGPPPVLPFEYLLKRFVINTASLWTWLPYIILISCRENHFWESLIFGTAFSGFCVVFNILMFLFKQKQTFPYQLDVAFTIFFVIYCGIYNGAPQYQPDLEQWMMIVVHAWISFVMLVSIAIRRPFTLQYARDAAPMEAWQSRTLLNVCDQLAGMWAGSFGLTCLLCLAPILTDRAYGNDGLNIVFLYLWPVLSLLGLLGMTRWWPELIRRIYYIPRMMQNSVKPDGSDKTKLEGNSTGTPAKDGDRVPGSTAVAGNAGSVGNTTVSTVTGSTVPPGIPRPPVRGAAGLPSREQDRREAGGGGGGQGVRTGQMMASGNLRQREPSGDGAFR